MNDVENDAKTSKRCSYDIESATMRNEGKLRREESVQRGNPNLALLRAFETNFDESIVETNFALVSPILTRNERIARMKMDEGETRKYKDTVRADYDCPIQTGRSIASIRANVVQVVPGRTLDDEWAENEQKRT